jgi:hypothetical protein
MNALLMTRSVHTVTLSSQVARAGSQGPERRASCGYRTDITSPAQECIEGPHTRPYASGERTRRHFGGRAARRTIPAMHALPLPYRRAVRWAGACARLGQHQHGRRLRLVSSLSRRHRPLR